MKLPFAMFTPEERRHAQCLKPSDVEELGIQCGSAKLVRREQGFRAVMPCGLCSSLIILRKVLGLLLLLVFLFFRIDQLVLLLLAHLRQSAGCHYLEAVLYENVRGTRGPSATVSKGDNELALRYLAQPRFEPAERDIDVAFHGPELFNFFWLPNIQEV